MHPEQLWERWLAAQRSAVKLMSRKDFAGALLELDHFLAGSTNSEIQHEVLAFRGLIKEELGRLEEAKDDLLAAHSLSPPASYQRFTVELTLARLGERMHSEEEAAEWYLRALETAVKDPLTSGATAIQGLLKIRGRALKPAERVLCEKVASQAWQLFALPGEPDLSDEPERTLQALFDASTRPVPHHVREP